MKGKVLLTSFGFINEKGFGGTSAYTSWDVYHRDMRRTLRWRMISPLPYQRFGRLDLLSKYALVAVENLGLPFVEHHKIRSDTAVVMGTVFGCQDVDFEYYRSVSCGDGASPSLFTYTLPNIAIGEISMRHHIGGPSYCFMAGRESGLVAVWEAVKLIDWDDDVKRCICLYADALSPEAQLMPEKLNPSADPFVCHAYAFLFEESTCTAKHGRTAIAEISLKADARGRCKRSVDMAIDVPEFLEFLMNKCKGETERSTADSCRPGVLELPAPQAIGTDEILVVSLCEK